MPNEQQKLTEFDSTDDNDDEYTRPWTCPGCGHTTGSVRRPAHLRECDEWGDSL